MPEDRSQSSSGTSMLVVMSVATVILTAAIAGFCALQAWWLLPMIVVCLLAAACGIVAFLFRVMGDEGELTPEAH